MSAKSALLLCPLLLVCWLLLQASAVAGHSESRDEIVCARFKSVAFKKVGGFNRVGLFKLRSIGNGCQKVLLTADSEDAYVTEKCQRCRRGPSNSWNCDAEPERSVDSGNCRSVLGPDCIRYSTAKDDETSGCA